MGGSSNPTRSTTQSLEPADFPETAEEPAIGGLLRLGFGLRRDRFWPENEDAFAAHQQTPHFKALIAGEALPKLVKRERAQYAPL